MRPGLMAIVVVAAVALSVAIYYATGGHFIFVALPLLFALPLFGRRRR